MAIKVKIVSANSPEELEAAVNVFLSTFLPANVLDVSWGPSKAWMYGRIACFITYQE